MREFVKRFGLAAEFFSALATIDHFVIAAFRFAGGYNFVFANGIARRVSEFVKRFGLAAEFFTAFAAIDHFVVTARCFAGSCNFVFANGIARRVSELVERLGLTAEFFAADGAVDYFVIAALGGAGGGNFVLNHRFARGVAERVGCLCLAAEFFAADGAISYAVIAAALGAIGFNHILIHRVVGGMTKRVDHLRRQQPLFAGGAFYTFGRARFGAGRRDGRNDLNRVVKLVDRFGSCFAAGTAGVGHFARFGTGCCFGHNAVIPVMSAQVSRLGFGRAADSAGIGFHAVLGAGGSGGFHAVIPGVFQRGHDLIGDYFAAAHAKSDFEPDTVAGRRFFIDRFVMAESGDFNRFGFAAARAGLDAFTCFGAGWRGSHGGFTEVMAERVNGGGFTAQFFAANGTVDHAVIAARCGAGGGNLVFGHRFARGVRQRFGFAVGVAVAAAGAGMGGVAARTAGSRRFCRNIVMAQRFCCKVGTAHLLAADGAVGHFVIAARFGAGGGNSTLFFGGARHMVVLVEEVHGRARQPRVVAADRHIHPFFRCAEIGGTCQLAAVKERRIADGCHAFGNRYACELGGGPERRIADNRHADGDGISRAGVSAWIANQGCLILVEKNAVARTEDRVLFADRI